MTDFDPSDLRHWINVLRNAALVKKGSPDYDEARDVARMAVRHIKALNVGANMAEANEQPGAIGSTAAALLHGASLGTGEVLSGLSDILPAGPVGAKPSGSFRQGAQRYRDAMNAIETAHPLTTFPVVGAEGLGSLALPSASSVQGLKLMRPGVPVGIKGAANIAARGAVFPAIAGFSAGGEDPGDIPARLREAGKGAILGALLTGLAGRVNRGHIERVADLENKGTARALTRERLLDVQERRTARAARTTVDRSAPPAGVLDNVERGPEPPLHPDAVKAIGDYEAGKLDGEGLRVALDVAAGRVPEEPIRAAQLPVEGEVSASAPPLDPIPGHPKGFTAEGPPTPPPPTAPTVREMQAGIRDDPIAQQMARGAKSSKPGHPVWYGEGSPTRSAEVRGGPPPTPSARSLEAQPFARLKALLDSPETPEPTRTAVQRELQRRGIVTNVEEP